MIRAPERLEASQEDIDEINGVALDYLEGYVTGDAKRHAQAYHPEAIKRRYHQDEQGVVGVTSLSPQTMADFASLSSESDCEVEVIIDAISEDIASVRVYSCNWVDFLHVVKARGKWKLFHVTWHGRTEPSRSS